MGNGGRRHQAGRKWKVKPREKVAASLGGGGGGRTGSRYSQKGGRQEGRHQGAQGLEGTCSQKEGQLAGMKAQAGMRVADRLTD